MKTPCPLRKKVPKNRTKPLAKCGHICYYIKAFRTGADLPPCGPSDLAERMKRPEEITNMKKENKPNGSRIHEAAAEYLTKYRKIVHDKIVVIDFEITNTVEFQTINNVSIEIDNLQTEGFDFDKTEIIQIKSLKTSETGHLYFGLLKEKDEVYSNCSFNCTLKFDLQELDVKGNPHGIPVKETYKLDKTKIRLFGEEFIGINKNNFRLMINNQEEELCQFKKMK